MLLTFIPPAFVLSAVCPLVESVTLLFVVHKLAVISHLIIVDVEPKALHVIVKPLPVVHFARRPDLLAETTDLVLCPLAIVDCSVRVGVLTLTVL